MRLFIADRQSVTRSALKMLLAAEPDFDGIEQPVHHPAHQFVLGLVLEPRLAAPGGDEKGRDAEGVIERGQRIDGVPQPRVLVMLFRLERIRFLM